MGILEIIGGILAAIVGAIGWGFVQRRNGRKDERQENATRRIEAIEEKQDVEKEMETADDQRLVDLISRRD